MHNDALKPVNRSSRSNSFETKQVKTGSTEDSIAIIGSPRCRWKLRIHQSRRSTKIPGIDFVLALFSEEVSRSRCEEMLFVTLDRRSKRKRSSSSIHSSKVLLLLTLSEVGLGDDVNSIRPEEHVGRHHPGFSLHSNTSICSRIK